MDNNWAEWETRRGPETNGDRCGRASDSWERFDEDLANLRWLGVDLYRFSVEWSRVESTPGLYDDDALDRYRLWCLRLRAAGIRPMVTLHHFTEPLWVTAKGGFENPAVVDDWLRFVAKVVDVLGDAVRLWTTVNEPVGYVTQGWLRGEWPPGRQDPVAAARVLEHLLVAHARAYHLIHEHAASSRGSAADSCQVGLAHHIVVFRPRRPGHPLDRLVARTLDGAYNRAVLEALRTGVLRLRAPGLRHRAIRPELVGTQDYIGLNHYYPMVVGFCWRAGGPMRGVRLAFDDEHERDDLGCTLDSSSLGEAVLLVGQYGLPIIITEHGVCDGDEPDRRRTRHLVESLTPLLEVRHGADVRGYVHWSLVDNFEWAYGHGARFGLFRVDPMTFERTPRSSAHVYREIIADTHRQLNDPGETREGPAR